MFCSYLMLFKMYAVQSSAASYATATAGRHEKPSPIDEGFITVRGNSHSQGALITCPTDG